MAVPAQLPTPQPGLLLYVSLPEGTRRAPGDLAEVAEAVHVVGARRGDRMSHLRLLDVLADPGDAG